MNILLEGAFYSGHGLAEGNRILLRILSRAGYRVRIRAIDKDWGKTALPPQEVAFLSSFEQTRLLSNDVFIHNWVGSEIRYNPDFRINIARTTFETDRIPDSWVPELNKFDEVWVQCTFNLVTFEQSGIVRPMVLIPNFFDESQYQPMGYKYPLRSNYSYRFLSVFDLRERKGYDILLWAYLNEFSKRDDVELVIKIRSGKTLPMLKDVLSRHPKNEIYRPAIQIISHMMSPFELFGLYRTCDAFVLPTRGEGWGRPFFEAMLMQMPVIGTNWSGQTDFMNEDNSYPIRVDKLVPVQHNPSLKGHYWAQPSMKDLRAKMRYVQKHPKEAMKKGILARKYLLSNFSMKEAAQKVVREIEKFR